MFTLMMSEHFVVAVTVPQLRLRRGKLLVLIWNQQLFLAAMASFRVRGKTSVANLRLKHKPLRRLRFKTSPLSFQKACVNDIDDLESQEDLDAKHSVFSASLATTHFP